MAAENIGIEIAERFFHGVVEPLIARMNLGLSYAAALVGPGSEVLGYDTVLSRDHDWAPRMHLFLAVDDEASLGPALRESLDLQIPDTFEDFPVRIERSDPGAGEPLEHPGTGHRIVVTTLPTWSEGHLGWPDPSRPTVADWLATPQQRLLEVTAGRVFRDDTGEVTAVRTALAWYPDDVWRYLLACQWQRVAQLEPFVGRTGDVGDDLGSRLIAATLVSDAMRLSFLIERRYAPYAKWFGTAFAALPVAAALSGRIDAALRAEDWRDREAALVSVFETLGHATNDLGLAEPVNPSPRRFYDRPYRVIDAHRFRVALDRAITEPGVREIVGRLGWVGAVDQFSDNVDLLASPDRIASLLRFDVPGPERRGPTT